MLVLPEKAVMGGEERVLVEEVDEVDNVKDIFHMIFIAIIITKTIYIFMSTRWTTSRTPFT